MSSKTEQLAFTLPSSTGKSKLFKCAEHANNISTKLQTFYNESDFLDIALIAETDQTKLEAHRVVLSACSDYFLAMFRSSLKEAKAYEVKLKEVDGATLKCIIDFMYTATIEIRNEIVENVLRAADFFQMSTLISACCDFLSEQLDTSNCLGIALFAEQHNYIALMEKSLTFAYNHFEQVCGEKEFMQLNKEQLIKFISPDGEEQHTRSEEKLVLNVVAWVKHDNVNRKEHIFELLSNIRYKMLTPKFIVDNINSVCNAIECYELIHSWLQWHLSFKVVHLKAPQMENLILVVRNTRTMWTLNSQQNSWSPLNLDISVINNDCRGLIFKNKLIVIVGGQSNERISYGYQPTRIKVPICFDLQRHEWSDLPAMTISRRLPALAELNGELYVVGGAGINSVEKYDFYTRKWSTLASLSQSFEEIQVAVLGGFLYVVGNGCQTMDCYDPNENKWTPKQFVYGLNFGFAAVGGHLYSIGGNRGGETIRSCYKYDAVRDNWELLSSIAAIGNALCTSIKNQLVIYEENTNVLSMYNPETGEKQNLPSLIQNIHQRSNILLLNNCTM